MKTNLLKLLFALVVTIIAVSSCQKNDPYNDDEWQKEQRRLDSLNRVRIEKLLEEQAPILKQYAEENMPGAVLDDSTGIWYKIHNSEDEESIRYRLVPVSGGLAISPRYTEVKYTGRLLDDAGTIFDKTEEDKTAVFDIGSLIPAWYLTFWPKEIEYNLRNYVIGGFTPQGLNKGISVEILTPSPYAYDNRERKNEAGEVIIPADSPLHFHIEVVDLRDQEQK